MCVADLDDCGPSFRTSQYVPRPGVMRKGQMGLTEEERRLLLADLAEIAAELDELEE
jgi:truncated hemoglobin YjbI